MHVSHAADRRMRTSKTSMGIPQPLNPSLSFIIPAFNAVETLRATLDSVARQSRSDWEAIVIDDGSTDDTASIASGFGDLRVHVIRQSNRGLAGARNTGLRHARGEFVAFLDADDLVQPEFADRLLGSIGEDDVAPCAYELVGPACESFDWVQQVSSSDLAWDRLIYNNPLAVTVAVRRAALTRCLGCVDAFDESLRVLEDWDLWLRLVSAGVRWAEPLHEPLVRVRLRRGSLSQGVERMHATGLRVISSHARSHAERCSAERRWNLLHAARFMACGDGDQAKSLLGASVPISNDEWPLLASMYLSACRRASLMGPREVERHRSSWRDAITRLLPTEYAEPLCWALDRMPADWRTIGREFVLSLRPGDIPVILGVGINGMAALDGACEVSTSISWIDDRSDATVPKFAEDRSQRLTREQLTPSHVVLVTPCAGESLSCDLRRTGIRVYERLRVSYAA